MYSLHLLPYVLKTSISVCIHILLGIYTVLRFLFMLTSNTASRLFPEVPKGGLIHLSMSFLPHVLALPLLVVVPLVIPCSFLPFFRYFLHDNRTLIIPHSHFIHFCLTLGRLKTYMPESKNDGQNVKNQILSKLLFLYLFETLT